MIKPLDELDEALKQRVFEMPGACVQEVIRPFLLERSESVLRQRVRALELRQLIRSHRTKREVQLYPITEILGPESVLGC
jgi:predicted transcriptional regulator